jgi:hypothetical protein
VNPYDSTLGKVVVNGLVSPGRARIQGAGIVYTWEIRQGYGRSGATVVGMGRGLSKFTLFIDMWEPTHFLIWEVFKAMLEPPKPMMPALAVDMQNPILADLGIASVVVEERGQIEKGDNGVWTVASKILEYRKPLPALIKPRGSIPAPGGAVAAKTEADKALVKAKADFEKAKAGG